MHPSHFEFHALTLLTLLSACSMADAAKGPAYTDPEKAGPDFEIQGEYVGEIETKDGKDRFGMQVIALGKGKFRAVGYRGGLPGAGGGQREEKYATGEMKDGVAILQVDDKATITIDGGKAEITAKGESRGTMEKVERKSPTLGAKPPKGAVVLFDGTSTDHFPGAKATADGLLMQGATSKDKFQSFQAHLEFKLPFMPQARGQGRGNSGYYVQGRYEVQMLDSFGLEGKDNECGGIYQIAAPKVNMCLPPLSWQTYDVDFTAAEFKDGKKVKNARLTVRHNGVVIHDDLELPQHTPGGKSGETAEPGPVYLQNHGDPIRYRNIWVLPK